MVSLLCHLHFWTLKALSPGTASGGDLSSHVYHEKMTGKKDTRGTVEVCRTEWAEGRGITWTPRNKKPEKLRETIREYEDLMSMHRPISVKWKTHRHCLVLLENGILVTFVLSKHSGDVERIFIDRSLLTRLQSIMDNALIVGSNIVLTITEDPRPACVSISNRRSSAAQVPLTLKKTDSGRRLEKLSSLDPKILFSDMGGMPVGGVDRHMIVSYDLVVVWWKEQGQQCSSMTNKGHDLLLLTLTNGKLVCTCGVELNFDPVDIQFSKFHSNVLLSLEKTSDSTYQCCTYEFKNNNLSKKSFEPIITSEANILVCEWSRDESTLLLACDNRTLILHDCTSQRQAIKAQVYFTPISLIRWHPGGAVVFVCGPLGEIQCFDSALNPLTFQTLSETPSPTPLLQIGAHFMSQVRLKLADWGSQLEGGGSDNFLMVFDKGPVVVVKVELGVLSRGQLGPEEMVSQYIAGNQLDQAILVLSQQSWTTTSGYVCFTLIMDHLLTQTLSRKTEEQITTTLTLFQSKEAHYMHKTHINHLTRRFFHLLVRNKRLEKAMDIAESIGAKDLFMDVHFLAVDLKRTKLADMAKQKAEKATSDFFTDVLQAAGIAHHNHSLSPGY